MIKNILLIFTILFFTNLTHGQILEIDIDSTLFNKKTGDVYHSDSTGATLILILLPTNYNTALKGMLDQSNKKITIIDKGELKHSETNRIYYKKGTGVKNDKNETEIIKSYLIEYSDNQSVLLSAIYKNEHDKLIGDSVDLTAKSIKPSKK